MIRRSKMKQSFIKLGEGLTDLFEFITLIEYNHTRIDYIVYFHKRNYDKEISSIAIIMKPTKDKHVQAHDIMGNALKYPYPESNKKFDMINKQAAQFNLEIKEIDVQPPERFHP